MKKGIRPTTRYVRLLNYENACKLIDFINKNDTGKIESDYAYITTGGVGTQVNDENWGSVIEFLKGLNVNYEVGVTPLHIVEKEIVSNLRKTGKIK